MPGGDGTGPRGMGPGMWGTCCTNVRPGWGRRGFYGCGRGWGRGFGFPIASDPYRNNTDMEAMKEQIRFLDEERERAMQRLKELEQR